MPRSREDVEAGLKVMILNKLKKKPDEVSIEPGSGLAKLGLDSLDQADLIMEIEDDFHVSLKEEDTNKAQTFAELVTLVHSSLPPDA